MAGYVDYTNYTEKDFIRDESFRSWVLDPDPELESFWISWLERYPEKVQTLANAKSFILSLHYQQEYPGDTKKAEIFSKVIEQSEQRLKTKKSKKNVRLISLIIFKNAAVWILFIASLATIIYFFENNQQGATPISTSTYYTKETKAGEKLTLNLSDGSTIKLNAGSSIRIARDFTEQREVYLDGEAFFDIMRDTLRPFIVHNNNVEIKVLGTSFNVSGKKIKNKTEVAVATGMVAVSSTYSSKTILLRPNEKLSCSTDSLVRSSFDADKVLGWKEGIIVFDQANLQEIATKLEAWYGCDIILKDKTSLSRKFSGKFQNQSLEEVLEGIQFTSDIKFEIKDKTVVIQEKNSLPMK